MADGPSNFDRQNMGQMGGGSGAGGPTTASDGAPAINGSVISALTKAVTSGVLPATIDYTEGQLNTTKPGASLGVQGHTAISGQQPGKIAKGMEKMHADLQQMNAESWPKFQVTDMGVDHNPSPMGNNSGGFAAATASRKSDGGFDGPG